MLNSKALSSDFDGHWKKVIEVFFEDLIAFCLPDLYDQVDFSQKPVFLEQELHKLIADWGKKGKRYNDKLAKVWLKNGEERWVLVHIEVQDDPDPGFPERVFVYYYRIRDHHKRKLTSLVIYSGTKVPPSAGQYQESFFGTKIVFRFNTLNIKDLNEKELIKSENPFALVALAGLYSIKSEKDFDRRLSFKYKLIKFLLERNMPKEKIVKLFIFIRFIVVLPLKGELKFNQKAMELFEGKEETKEVYGLHLAEPLIQVWTKKLYGKTFEEAEEAQKKLLAEKTESFITMMYEKGGISIEEIAESLKVEADYVKNILKKNDLI